MLNGTPRQGPAVMNRNWEDICSSDNLAFRAACNAVADPDLRPLKKRVIERLCQDREAKALFRGLWQDVGNDQNGQQVEAFFRILANNSAWQTLVNEAVGREKSWLDLLRSKYFITDPAKFLDWFVAFAEKLWDKHHPAARTATSIALSLSTLFIVHHYERPVYDELTLPIRAIFTGDQPSIPVSLLPSTDGNPVRVVLAPSVGGPPVKVDFVPSNDGKGIPVALHVEPDSKAVKVQFVADGGIDGGNEYKDALNSLVTQLNKANNSLRGAAADLRVLSHQSVGSDLDDMSKTFHTVANSLSDTTSNLKNFDRRMSDLGQAYADAAAGRSVQTGLQIKDINQKLQVVARANASQREMIPLVLQAGASKSIVLPMFDSASGRSSSTIVTISASKVNGAGNANSIQLAVSSKDPNLGQVTSAPASPEIWADAKEGDVLALASLGWRLTVNGVERHWFRKPYIRMTLSPEAGPIS